MNEKATLQERPHPDDCMRVSLMLEFLAEPNPKNADAEIPWLEMTLFECTPPLEEAANYLEKVVQAIRERRLFGFMVQEAAGGKVAIGEWIKKRPVP
jgi:hypothetical protein